MSQLQTRLVPVVGRLGFDGHQMALRDTLGRLIHVRTASQDYSTVGALPCPFIVRTSDLIEDFAVAKRTSKAFHQLPVGSGLVASTSFEL
jgi:hypothetical protein